MMTLLGWLLSLLAIVILILATQIGQVGDTVTQVLLSMAAVAILVVAEQTGVGK
jgi:hypothetical protein